jgi:DNA (cytosine-5)-methyltransferase 1
MSNPIIYGASLFANVGIDETYLKEIGVEMKVSNELLEKRCNFYSHLYPDVDMICGDITDNKVFKRIVKAYIDNGCSFLIATPPCQGMSVAGKMDKFDPRNELIKYVVKFVKQTNPDNILIENVAGLLKFRIRDERGNVLLIKDYIIKSFEKMGYNVNYGIFDAADFGTAQHRRRAIFLISKKGIWNPPEKKEHITVRKMISDLESLMPGESGQKKFHFAKMHAERHIKWMSHTPEGKTAHLNKKNYPIKPNGEKIRGYATTYKRMEWDKPAPTITMANGSISSQNNVHPGRPLSNGLFSDPRVLTLLELFRLSGLPDDWNVPEWATDNLVRQVVGESFPPKFCLEMVKEMPR